MGVPPPSPPPGIKLTVTLYSLSYSRDKTEELMEITEEKKQEIMKKENAK